MLLEATPEHIKLDELVSAVTGITGVKNVHDVHVWSITPEIHAMSGHVLIEDQAVSQSASVREEIEDMLKDRFQITHSTLQLECESCETSGVLCSLQPGRQECGHEHAGGDKAGGEKERS